uniref:Discs, large (Drosophila) homolog-associated protein 5 n=1 Tax=Salarias fasciatus TaxID=181472 RepID=A0A672GHQ8_SALFA
MESRFAHLRQRDTSVSMLRTKMSRRRSQSQKENRERTVNTRRQLRELDQIPETKPAPSKGEDRMKQLECWKERKALEKEKAKREKEGKGVFKTGSRFIEELSVPFISLSVFFESLPETVQPAVVKVSSKPSTFFNNSFKVDFDSKYSLTLINLGHMTSDPCPGSPSTTDCCVFVVQDAAQVEAVLSEVEEVPPPPAADQTAGPQEEDMAVDPAPPADPAQPSLSSFAPAGFVFQAPVGLAAFKFEPMTPRSADAFLTPRSSLIPSCCPAPASSCLQLPSSPTSLRLNRLLRLPAALRSRSTTCRTSGILSFVYFVLLSRQTIESVLLFRSEIARETERLTALSLLWESKVEDESIPEDMRDGMRTAVGQARLLMKERFGQFAGLVDDCELGRGDRVTTCSDLQGFWDMVHYQVEDVGRKFDALKEAEGRGWAEEHRPPPRQRKAVKKPSAAPAKPAAGRAAAAKSRLAAVKAAMKARQQAAEAEPAGKTEDEPEPSPEEARPGPEVPAQDGGFFKLESPAKPPGEGIPARRDLDAGFDSRLHCPVSSHHRFVLCFSNMDKLNTLCLDFLVSSFPCLYFLQVQTAEAAMLLFTPDMSDRIRQSVCPSDLMVFTPPI